MEASEATGIGIDNETELTVPDFVVQNGQVDAWARDRERSLFEPHRPFCLHEAPVSGEFRDEHAEVAAKAVRRNFDAAVASVPELATLEAAGQLKAAFLEADDGFNMFNRMIIETALTKLVRHKLFGEIDGNVFHPKSHLTLQLNDDTPERRLAITFARLETEVQDEAGDEVERTFKRALVYDLSKPEGWRFYEQHRGLSTPRLVDTGVRTNGEPEHPIVDNIEMEQQPHPVPTGELLKLVKALAESNAARPSQETE